MAEREFFPEIAAEVTETKKFSGFGVWYRMVMVINVTVSFKALFFRLTIYCGK
jgi:hypothetical protein